MPSQNNNQEVQNKYSELRKLVLTTKTKYNVQNCRWDSAEEWINEVEARCEENCLEKKHRVIHGKNKGKGKRHEESYRNSNIYLIRVPEKENGSYAIFESIMAKNIPKLKT